MARRDVTRSREYLENEGDANRHISYVDAVAGVLALAVWILYLTRVFEIPDYFFPAVAIMFPLFALVLFVPLALLKTKAIYHPAYKYFILFSFLAVVASMNVAIPKHGVLFWPFAVIMANHYYRPTVGFVVYAVTVVAMLVCLYLGMLFGEFDENLYGAHIVISVRNTLAERLSYLRRLAKQGDNRYVKVFVYYYLPRATIVSLIFLVSQLLNRRTYALLDREIRIHGEQERATAELGVAKSIQLNALPRETFVTDRVSILGELRPAHLVGGDLYDYLNIDENHVAVLIGDVAGKGVPAAMFMMRTIASFRDFAAPGKSPSTILSEVNASLVRGNGQSMFVTAFLAILDTRDGRMAYANAGHNPPLIGSGVDYRYLECDSGFVLGCAEETFLSDEETVLAPGQRLILYTDGVTEAQNGSGDLFGERRLLDLVRAKERDSLVKLHRDAKEGIASFVEGAPQSDDIAFVTLEYHPEGVDCREKTFPGKKKDVPAMLNFLNAFAADHRFPAEFASDLHDAAEGLLAAIVERGFGNKAGKILMCLRHDGNGKEFFLTLTDEGMEFDPLGEEGGASPLPIKEFADGYAYDRINGKNVLTLRKKVLPSAE